MTFEDYLRSEVAAGKIDFAFRVVPDMDGIAIYVHPDGRDGNTTPNLVVAGNTLTMSRGSAAPGWTHDDDD